jgi:undecaprenyl-diphosphatase
LLATPITAGATLLGARHLLKDGVPAGSGPALAAGILTSGIVGYLAIAFFLRHLRTKTLAPFVYYRLAMGGFVLLMSAGGWLK